MTYTYTGNQLNQVQDTGDAGYGFKAANASYNYDINGNMTADSGKGISSINYNHLNLPESITINVNTIGYVYDASGAKLSKTANGQSTQYSGATVYKDDNLEFINTPEGYIEPQGDNYRYVYRLTDHLGNTRVSFFKNTVTDEVDVLATNDYYPFGLEHQKAENTARSSNLGQNFKYNGKERDATLGWDDFGARMYNPELGRWMNFDPLAEQMRRHSPYNYAFDNPIFFIDPDGMAPFGFDTELYDQNGNKIREDENGIDGTIAIVTNESEVEKVKSNTSEGKHTESNSLKSTVKLPSSETRTLQMKRLVI